MSTAETIDRLCSITSELADIVYQQALLLMQADFDTDELKQRRDEAALKLDVFEFNLRETVKNG